MESERDSCRQHVMLQFLGSAGSELATEQGFDLSRLGIQQFGQYFCVVAVSGEARFQVFEIWRRS
jgi:hypothetical protein